jgi:hypothetical protein
MYLYVLLRAPVWATGRAAGHNLAGAGRVRAACLWVQGWRGLNLLICLSCGPNAGSFEHYYSPQEARKQPAVTNPHKGTKSTSLKLLD